MIKMKTKKEKKKKIKMVKKKTRRNQKVQNVQVNLQREKILKAHLQITLTLQAKSSNLRTPTTMVRWKLRQKVMNNARENPKKAELIKALKLVKTIKTKLTM